MQLGQLVFSQPARLPLHHGDRYNFPRNLARDFTHYFSDGQK